MPNLWARAAIGPGPKREWRRVIIGNTFHKSSPSRAAVQADSTALHAQNAPCSGTTRVELWPYTTGLVDGILAGSRTALSRAITLVESQRLDHRRQAELLLDRVLSARRGSQWQQQHQATAGDHPKDNAPPGQPSTFPNLGMRVGIAGPPGAGKSSFIEVLGKTLTTEGKRVAVISIDPSSVRTGGSILGDKTRMHELSRHPSAFVRGCPASGVLGGLSRYTHEVVLLCQVAGYDPVIVETVGLGQSEVEVEHTVDMLLLLLPPAAGDDLQGSKKGIVEVADAVVVNKSDGELEKAARATASDYASALLLSRRKFSCWNPPVLRCSALLGNGIGAVWEEVTKFKEVMQERGLLDARRREQALHWLQRHLQQQLMDRVAKNGEVKALAKSLEPRLAQGTLSPRAAAEKLVDYALGAEDHGGSRGRR